MDRNTQRMASPKAIHWLTMMLSDSRQDYKERPAHHESQ